MSLWLIIAGVAILAVVGLILRWFWRIFKPDLLEIGGLFWNAWCIWALIRWRLRSLLRKKYVRTALAVGLGGSFWVFLHAGVLLWGQLAGHRESDIGEQATPGTFAGIITALSHAVPPLWLEGVLVVLSGLIVWHQVHEWRLREREMILPRELGDLVSECSPYLKATKLTDEQKSQFFQVSMERISNTLKTNRKEELAISLMTPTGASAALRVQHIYPAGTTLIDKNVELPTGQGAAGKAMEIGTVYVPSVAHRGGINALTEQSVGLVFRLSDTQKKAKGSLICSRVQANAAARAVISVSTGKRDAFEPLDIEIVKVGAIVLGGVEW